MCIVHCDFPVFLWWRQEKEPEAPKPRFGFGAGTRKVSISQPAAKPEKRAARAARTAPKQVLCCLMTWSFPSPHPQHPCWDAAMVIVAVAARAAPKQARSSRLYQTETQSNWSGARNLKCRGACAGGYQAHVC